jgi:hypothetical protein
MDLLELVSALMRRDALTARQWVADALRAGFDWSTVPEPAGLDPVDRAVAAGVVELLAGRAGRPAPPWTAAVPPSPRPFCLVRAAESMPRLRRECEEEGPWALRRRGILAPPEFLTAA